MNSTGIEQAKIIDMTQISIKRVREAPCPDDGYGRWSIAFGRVGSKKRICLTTCGRKTLLLQPGCGSGFRRIREGVELIVTLKFKMRIEVYFFGSGLYVEQCGVGDGKYAAGFFSFS